MNLVYILTVVDFRLFFSLRFRRADHTCTDWILSTTQVVLQFAAETLDVHHEVTLLPRFSVPD